MRTHPSAIIDNELDEESGYFEKLGAKTEHFLEQFFTVWGTWCANNPWNVLLLGMYNKFTKPTEMHAISNYIQKFFFHSLCPLI